MSNKREPSVRENIQYERGFIQGLKQGYLMGEKGHYNAMVKRSNSRSGDIQELKKMVDASDAESKGERDSE